MNHWPSTCKPASLYLWASVTLFSSFFLFPPIAVPPPPLFCPSPNLSLSVKVLMLACSALHFQVGKIFFQIIPLFFLRCIWADILSIKPAAQSEPRLISFMPSAHTALQPSCVVPFMNLNLIAKQLPSIILAATANSSPASHFFPLKNAFFLNAVMELLRSPACWEMTSQQPRGPFAFHKWKEVMHSSVYSLLLVHKYNNPHVCVNSLQGLGAVSTARQRKTT